MTQTSRLGEPSTPNADPAAPRLVVAFPDAHPSRRYWSLLALAGRLDQDTAAGVTAVCWQTGPLVRAIRATQVIDAGAVNDGLVPRALAGMRLRPVARAAKSHALRRLLAPLGSADHLVLGDASTLPLLDWLPPRPARRIVVWLGDDEVDQVDEVVAVADLVLVDGPRATAAVSERAPTSARWQRVAEPLVDAPADTASDLAGRRRVLLLGGPDGVAEAAPAAIAGAQTARTTVVEGAATEGRVTEERVAEVTWLHITAAARDERWIDPRFAGLGSLLSDATMNDARPRIADLAAVVLAGPTPLTLEDTAGPAGTTGRLGQSPSRFAVTAALAGVPVLGLGVTEALVEDTADPVDLRDRLRRVLSDPSAWADAGAGAAAKAQPHRIDLAASAVLDALSLDGP